MKNCFATLADHSAGFGTVDSGACVMLCSNLCSTNAMAGLITSELATSLQKNKRKTFGFGTYIKKERRWVGNEVHIRELSIGEAGLGCALWDASIILGRCLFAQRALLAGKKILEVGAGCGLPAIIAGMFAAESVGTDYIDKVCDRARDLIVHDCVFMLA